MDVEANRGSIASVPVWVKLFNVPKFLWNPKGLSSLTSTIGKPICCDKMTEKRTMLNFARVSVEVEAEKTLPSVIKANIKGNKVAIMRVEYPWKPSICTICKAFGHTNESCGKDPAPKPFRPQFKPQRIIQEENQWMQVNTKGVKKPDLPLETKNSQFVSITSNIFSCLEAPEHEVEIGDDGDEQREVELDSKEEEEKEKHDTEDEAEERESSSEDEDEVENEEHVSEQEDDEFDDEEGGDTDDNEEEDGELGSEEEHGEHNFQVCSSEGMHDLNLKNKNADSEIVKSPCLEKSVTSDVTTEISSIEKTNDRVHFRVRNIANGNLVTIINGMDPRFSCWKILKAFREDLHYKGEIVREPDLGLTIQVEGDLRKPIATFFVEEKLATLSQIKIHRSKKANTGL
ncbi:hypothetical protein FRX31_005647 [Thalictrum thalictroides]|uniref:SUI1 domain-containing protein n=1 Tax=Thalictrum thalictroides TaxID=46969 RepID=A0A7J6X6R8_THATH|nr:hypothetical protein FRX31_005647 [Thalictrum thalictroides]